MINWFSTEQNIHQTEGNIISGWPILQIVVKYQTSPSMLAKVHPGHILEPRSGGNTSSLQLCPFFGKTQTLLGSSAYRYFDFDPPIKNKAPFRVRRHPSAIIVIGTWFHLSNLKMLLFLFANMKFESIIKISIWLENFKVPKSTSKYPKNWF